MIFTTLVGSIILSAKPEHRFFTVGKAAFGRDAFLTPVGKPFWSFGVCCTDRGTPKDKDDPKNPSYGSWQHFKNDQEWALDTVKKLRSWGFNTLGGWSDYSLISKLPAKERMPYTVVLHLGAYYRAPWDDLFSADALKEIDKAAKTQIVPIKNDPNLIGYFTDNELGWWDDTVFLNYVVKLPAGSAGRLAAHATLRKLYGSFSNFQRDWITTNKSWEDFAKAPNLFLRPERNGMRAVNAWMMRIGDYYYKTVYNAVKRYDKRHLVLGDRYCQYYNIAIAKSSAKWIDVCSTNSGVDWNDGTYSHFYFDTLHKITSKPIVVTEFYMAATENRSGNKNSSTAFPIVKNQHERAVSFARNLNSFGSLPYIIGAHWFQFTDEPMHGRGDGEDFNMGLLDTAGKPYEELTSAAKAAGTQEFPNQRTASLSRHTIPRITFDPMAAPNLKAWPRSSSLVRSIQGDAFADLYVIADKGAYYVGLYAMDYADQSLYKDGKFPESERIHWSLTVDNRKIDVRFGGDKGKKMPLPLSLTGDGVTAIEHPDLKHTIILRIPKTDHGRPQSSIKIQSQLDTHSRAETMRWDTTLSP